MATTSSAMCCRSSPTDAAKTVAEPERRGAGQELGDSAKCGCNSTTETVMADMDTDESTLVYRVGYHTADTTILYVAGRGGTTGDLLLDFCWKYQSIYVVDKSNKPEPAIPS